MTPETVFAAHDPGAVATLVTDIFDGDAPLFAVALARMLETRIHRAIAEPAALEDALSWIAATCATHPLEPRVARLMRAVPAAIAARARDERAGPPVASIAAAIELGLASHDRAGEWRLDPELQIDGAIGTLLMRLDAADALSAEHSRAVSLWCRRIALRLGLADEVTRFATRCGLLHDVGKASTPAQILNAARALTEAEWSVMRDHTLAGAALLASNEVLRAFEPAARSHHERLDGKGYPDRLEAREIPLSIRIVSVADSFNAMIGRRPYRLPLSPARAIEQLVAHRGTQFDPDVVEAMIDIIEHPISL